MNDTIKVICENGFGELEVPMGTPLLEVAERLTPGLHPFLAAFVNNRIKELNYKIYAPVTIRFVDITSFAGIRVCVCVLIFNAVVKLWKKSVIDKPTLAVFLVVFAGSAFFNLSPILFVILAAVAGILLKNKEVQAK